MARWSDQGERQAIADETRDAVLDTIFNQWREIRTSGVSAEDALDGLTEGLLAAVASLITAVTAPERRESMPRLAANRLIHQFKITRERGLDPHD
ncbi:hypothetical protein OHI65_14790 [Brucella sp. MAB-22]|uniref:hypothetical protein n=1 Tax=Brucella sp. MAB-22 TaxID=2986424 RepID=UPI00221FF088|nr:hypothetical protein [Brucella sp. MAB-22]UYT57735.1 hypothetical protein OHI65_14790 [Brucella sp. MAB-22]